MNDDRCFNAAEQGNPAMTEPLKPCPFPHDDDLPAPETIRHKTARYWYVACECGATGPARSTVEEAIAAWNRRPPLAEPTEAEVEAAAEAVFRAEGGSALWSTVWTATQSRYRRVARAALAAFVAGKNGAEMADDLVERLYHIADKPWDLGNQEISAAAGEAAAEIARLRVHEHELGEIVAQDRARPGWREGVEAAAAWHDEEARQSINLREDYLADYHTNCAANLRALKEPT